MTKVCHITSVHSSKDMRIFYKECVSLAQNGFEVYLLAKGESRMEAGVQVIGFGTLASGRGRRIKHALFELYKKALEVDADVYHIHDPELLHCGVKLKAAGKKVIFDSHENYFEQIRCKPYLPLPLRKIVARLYFNYETRVCKKIDAVIVPCLFQGVNIFEKRAKKTAFIDNYPIIKMSNGPESLDKVSQNSNICCYVGLLTADRGIENIVKAVQNTEAELMLAGPYYDPDFIEKIKKLDRKNKVTYLGCLDQNGVKELLSNCSIGLATLLNVGQNLKSDNFATKVLEYMEAGMPVIISDYPYAKKTFDHLECGICVNPESTNEISQAITILLKDKKSALKMGRNGKTAVFNAFNWSCEEKKLMDLYQGL